MIINKLEDRYWDLFQSVLPDEDLRPINYEEEKDKFLSEFEEKKQEYNPSFQYREFKPSNIILELEALEKEFEFSNLNFFKCYLEHIEKLKGWLTNFYHRDSNFPKYLYDLYGSPSKATLNFAIDYLAKNPRVCPEIENHTNANACEHFVQVLRDFGFLDWKVKSLTMPSKIRISSSERTIYVDTSSKFSDSELQRLSVHEVGTHVLRYENGIKQSSKLFKFGFPDYLECEEGLAILSEDKSGLLSDYDLGKYCLRVLASEACKNKSFLEVYRLMRQHANTELAYTITARVKRGLVDTSHPYGYSKDQVYLSGYLKCKKLSSLELKKLYVGKIGFKELNEGISNLSKVESVIYPSWML